MDFLHVTLAFVAGFIDSIAGGGGLITIPTLSLLLGMGVETIATNKVAGTTAAGVAFLIYAAKGHFNLRQGLLFSLTVGLGSFLGSYLSPLFPKWIFPYLLLITAPLMLILIWNKKVWQKKLSESHVHSYSVPLLLLSGFACGLYDGVWGPGGGTFMLMALLFVAGLKLMPAVAISKFANLLSASGSLIGYAQQDLVSWPIGLGMAVPIGLGAIIGASLANAKAEKVIRPVLTFIVILLLAKTLWDHSISSL